VLLRIVQLEEIQTLLRATPRLIDRYEHKRADFPQEVASWLKQVESALEQNRLHLVSQIAQLRAMLLGAQRGIAPDGLSMAGKASRRKLADAAALRALREATSQISKAIDSRTGQIAEASKIAQQIVAIASLKRLLENCQGFARHQERLQGLVTTIKRDSDLAPYYAALGGLVSQQDALVLLDRALADSQP
jgi:hypothetical protein